MSSPLLMTCKYMSNFIRMLIKSVIYIKDSSTWISKNSINTLFFQTFNDDF